VTTDRPDATGAGRTGEDPIDHDPVHHDPVHHDPGETSHLMLIALILFSVALAAVAQLTLKRGMDQVAAGTGVLRFGADSLRDVVTTPAVWVGLALFGSSAVVWLAVLSRASLSFAYPFASLTYVLILLADRFILEQEVPALRYAGVAFIVVGIVLVAQTRHA
jgi:drug/metabolite transporter (DMT)-like permease